MNTQHSQKLSKLGERVIEGEHKKKNLEFQQIQNIEYSKMDFKDNSFDVVISFQVIEHISDSMAYINELYRVLKRNGKIIIVTPDRVSRLFSHQKPWK